MADTDIQRIFQQAFAAHQRGQFSSAEEGYRAVLAISPDEPEALHYLGMVLFQQEHPAAAEQFMRRAVERRPDDAGYHLNYGSVLEAMGRISEARSQYETAVSLEPDALDARFNAGSMQMRQGDSESALCNFEAVLRAEPGDIEARVNCGHCLSALGRWEEARKAFEQAITDGASQPDAFAGAGQVCRELGDTKSAEEHYRRALRLRADDPALMNNLANVLRDTHRFTDARALLRKARSLSPDDASIATNSARVELDLGAARRAIDDLRDALVIAPDEPVILDLLSGALGALGPSEIAPALESDFELVWERYDNDPQRSARGLGALLEQTVFGDDGQSETDVFESDTLDRAAESKLLHRLLQRGLNVHYGLERKLIVLRRSLLQCSDEEVLARADLVAAIGLQCFGNEYIWPVSDRETDRIQAAVDQMHLQGETLWPGWCVALRMAMYDSLAGFLGLVEGIDQRGVAPSPLAAELWTRCVEEPAVECTLSAELVSLGQLTDATSHQVRAQYEVNPYPRWVGAPVPVERGLPCYLRRRFPRFRSEAGETAFDSILVAGCGTGFEPILLARGEPSSRIDAVDLSLSSLGYAARRARELSVANIEFVQGDLLEVGRLQKRYDLVVATGVLHHMADPVKGWRALTTVLRSGGLMRVALYSERARRSIATLREHMARHALEWNPSTMHVIRRRVLEADPADTIAELAYSDDLFATSAVRDLLFHVCEHRFTPAQLSGVLDNLALDFIGMEVRDLPLRNQFEAFAGQSCERADLAVWEAFEERHPRSFTAMMHFWCQARQ